MAKSALRVAQIDEFVEWAEAHRWTRKDARSTHEAFRLGYGRERDVIFFHGAMGEVVGEGDGALLVKTWRKDAAKAHSDNSGEGE